MAHVHSSRTRTTLHLPYVHIHPTINPTPQLPSLLSPIAQVPGYRYLCPALILPYSAQHYISFLCVPPLRATQLHSLNTRVFTCQVARKVEPTQQGLRLQSFMGLPRNIVKILLRKHQDITVLLLGESLLQNSPLKNPPLLHAPSPPSYGPKKGLLHENSNF